MFKISKQIEFDYGHRVPDHCSKCFNPHGHRGKVIAHCQSSSLIKEGEQSGMVLDFGFLKNVLQDEIHNLFDHNFLIYQNDQIMRSLFHLSKETLLRSHRVIVTEYHSSQKYEKMLTIEIHSLPFEDSRPFRIIVLPVIPTAENLAYLSFWMIKDSVEQLSNGNAYLTAIEFYETPTSVAVYKKNPVIIHC